MEGTTTLFYSTTFVLGKPLWSCRCQYSDLRLFLMIQVRFEIDIISLRLSFYDDCKNNFSYVLWVWCPVTYNPMMCKRTVFASIFVHSLLRVLFPKTKRYFKSSCLLVFPLWNSRAERSTFSSRGDYSTAYFYRNMRGFNSSRSVRRWRRHGVKTWWFQFSFWGN